MGNGDFYRKWRWFVNTIVYYGTRILMAVGMVALVFLVTWMLARRG